MDFLAVNLIATMALLLSHLAIVVDESLLARAVRGALASPFGSIAM